MTKIKETPGRCIVRVLAVGVIALATASYAIASDKPRYSTWGEGLDATERCVIATERYARGVGFGYANVTQINEVKRMRFGVLFEGRISLKAPRGYLRLHGFNRGKFTCYNYDHPGRHPLVDLSGVRGRR